MTETKLQSIKAKSVLYIVVGKDTGQQRNVIDALAQGWKLEVNTAQAMI